MQFTISDIRADDPDVEAVLRGLRQATYTINQILENGPAKRTKIDDEIAAGRLIVGRVGHIRFATNVNYARWLILLQREAATDAAIHRNRLKTDKARAGKHRQEAA